MKKYITDFKVIENINLSERIFLLKLSPANGEKIAETKAGQFVEVRVDGETKVFLRRPISIHYIDKDNNQLWLLIQRAGNGTNHLGDTKSGDIINIIYPLGNGFSVDVRGHYLLVGGGVGIAPLLELGKVLYENGNEVTFLLGGRTAGDLVNIEEYRKYGKMLITTEDGSKIDGLDCQTGFVTQHSCFLSEKYDFVRVCGPMLMMKAVAKALNVNNVQGDRKTICPTDDKKTAPFCEVSLENKMACGLGVCLCCVENTIDGHKCVCSDGPVFNIKDLKW